MNYYLYLIYNILWWNNLEVWLLLMFLKVKGILKIKSGELIMFWKNPNIICEIIENILIYIETLYLFLHPNIFLFLLKIMDFSL